MRINLLLGLATACLFSPLTLPVNAEDNTKQSDNNTRLYVEAYGFFPLETHSKTTLNNNITSETLNLNDVLDMLTGVFSSKVAVENDAAAEKAAAETAADVEEKAAEKAAAAEKFRAMLQNQSKHRIIMMMFLCPYESKSDRVLTEWLWKQTKDTVIDFFFMNDQEKNAYYTAHGPMHDSEAPEYTYEHAMNHQHDDYYWRDRELPSNVDYRRVSEKREE